ncbi:hypothetical protein SEA_MORRIGAN_58 [Microbacterium phage Morrigan]|nr:hypothetical protein SEA_MORRIGAN_58 [Microbacterium phage Morrigan]
MNQLAAFQETLTLAHERGMHFKHEEAAHESLTYRHLVHLHDQVHFQPDQFSPSKLGRWLGWTQAAVVASGCATLDEMKAINKRHAAETVATLDGATNEPAPGTWSASAGEFAARWNVLTPADRERYWEFIKDAQQRSHDCVLKDHESLQEEVTRLSQKRSQAHSELGGLLDSLDSHITQDEIYSAIKAIQEAL